MQQRTQHRTQLAAQSCTVLTAHTSAPSLLPSLTHLWTVLFPQCGDESLHCLIFHRDFIDMQIHAISQPELLQLLGTRGKEGTEQGGQVQVGQRWVSSVNMHCWEHSAEHAGPAQLLPKPRHSSDSSPAGFISQKSGVP